GGRRGGFPGAARRSFLPAHAGGALRPARPAATLQPSGDTGLARCHASRTIPLPDPGHGLEGNWKGILARAAKKNNLGRLPSPSEVGDCQRSRAMPTVKLVDENDPDPIVQKVFA